MLNDQNDPSSPTQVLEHHDSDTGSAPHPPRLAGLPACLLDWTLESRWAAWTRSPSDGLCVPYPVDPDDPSGPVRTATAPEAAAQVARAANGAPRAGFLLQIQDLPGLAVIELAWVRDPRSGQIRPWAAALAKGCGYAEVTPSGTGLLVLGRVAEDHPALHDWWDHPEGGRIGMSVCPPSSRLVPLTGQQLAGAQVALFPLDGRIRHLRTKGARLLGTKADTASGDPDPLPHPPQGRGGRDVAGGASRSDPVPPFPLAGLHVRGSARADDWCSLHAGPDLSLLHLPQATVPELDNETRRWLWGPWTGWIAAAAEGCGAPFDYVAMALLTVAGACLGNTRWVQPSTIWTEPPILWCVLVGAPSAAKTPALRTVLAALNAIENRWDRQHRRRLAEWEAQVAAAEDRQAE